jgi:hypothetical protein
MVLNFGEGAVTTAANISKQTARKYAFRLYVTLVNSIRPASVDANVITGLAVIDLSLRTCFTRQRSVSC